MFKKRKNVRKIIIILIAVITVLGCYIKFNKVTKDMYAPTLKNVNAEENVGLGHGTINPIYKPEWEKIKSSFSASEGTLTVTVKGSAYQSQNIDANTDINYASDVESQLKAKDVTVFIDGVDVTNTTIPAVNVNANSNITQPTVEVGGGTKNQNTTSQKNEITYTIRLSNLKEAVRVSGKSYTEWSGNIALKLAGRGKDSSTYNANILTDEYGNQSMMEKDTNGTWVNVEIKDTKTDHNTDNTMFADYQNPEIRYEYSTGNINYSDKTLTVEFSIADKYFSSTKLLKDDGNGNKVVNQEEVNKIQIALKDEPDSQINGVVTKKITNVTELTEERDGKTVTVGYKFTLVIGGLQQKTKEGTYRDYSGPMSIQFPSSLAEDKSGNTSKGKTITIGISDPSKPTDPGETVVDVVNPVWEAKNIKKIIDNSTGKMNVSMDLYGTDKYYKENSLTAEKVQLWVDGVNVTASGSSTDIVKSLTKVEDLSENGLNYGIHYKLEISGLEETDSKFNEQRNKYATNTASGRVYREYSGEMKVRIPENTILDNSSNKNEALEVALNKIDTIKPEIIKVSSDKNTTSGKETFVFDVVDKNLKTTGLGTTVAEANANKSKVTVYVDGEEASSVTKNYVKVEALKATINGTSKTVGYRYTLELTNFPKTRSSINYDREYTDWSGNVSIKFGAGIVTDTGGTATDSSGNAITIEKNENAETELQGDFIDVVKPDITYKYVEDATNPTKSDINKTDKTFTMVFDITDKFYDETKSKALSIDDLIIKIDNKDVDWTKVSKSLSSTNITNTVKITENGVVKSVTKVIGKRYTLKLSDLEQLQVKQGDKYLDYSGVVTVVVPASKMVDTSNNTNVAKTITSGINIPGGTGTGKVVDVVDPLFEKVSSSANAINKTATLNFKVTDKYFSTSTLTKDNIQIFINGAETKSGLEVSLTKEDKQEERTVNNVTSTVTYGIDYTLTVTNFASDVKQVKVVIPQGVAKDQSGNGNKKTEFILYNTLINTSKEKTANSGLLGSASSTNSKVKSIQRQNIDSITFMDNIPDNIGYDASLRDYKKDTAWDVSAQQDKSILAWYDTNANGSLKVYIGSNSEIFGNYNSSYLVAYIGYAEICTSQETIKNLNLLNTASVKNMEAMFRDTGYKSMKSLNLGNDFNTSNVTTMSHMFFETGYNAMTTLNLGTNFNTSNVTNMDSLFNLTGVKALTSLDLGTKFDTTKVTTMRRMFQGTGAMNMTSLKLGKTFITKNVTNMERMFMLTGYAKMPTLDLGEEFDTSKVTTMELMFGMTGYNAMQSLDLKDKFNTKNVTNMNYMFWKTGYTAMKTLNLGSNFDTSNVTSMRSMFMETGYTEMESLDLGDKFNVNKVEEMYSMFKNTGYSKLTSLDLGPMFTKIPSNYVSQTTDMLPDLSTNKEVKTNIPAHNGYDGMFDGTGKTKEIKIQASEQIYFDKNNFKLNTDATSSTINYTRGTINPKYRTEWLKEASTLTIDNNNINNSKITVTLRGSTNPEAGIDHKSDVTSVLTANDVQVFIDGEEATGITKTLSNAEAVTNTVTQANDVRQVLTLSGLNQGRVNGKSFQEWSGNITLKINKKTLKDIYDNRNLSAIDTSGTMKEITISDDKKDKNESGTMFIDSIKPEFTYRASDTKIIHGGKEEKVEITFDVIDKYFDTTYKNSASTALKKSDGTYDASKITVGIDDYDKTELNNAITKKLEKVQDLTGTVNGTANTKVGERFKLTITGLDPKDANGVGDGFKYSGYMTLAFQAGAIYDKSGNTNAGKTITIGRNEPGGSDTDKEVVDVVDPVWSLANADMNGGMIKIRIKDKFLIKDQSIFNVTVDKIKVLANGVESSEIEKRLSGPVEIVKDQEYEYTLTLTNITPEGGGYTEFTPTETIVGGTAKYRNENGGDISLEIEAGIVTDAYQNSSNKQTLEVGNIDGTGPEVYDVQKTQDEVNGKETIIFNVTDKNYYPDDTIAVNELSVLVDGKNVDNEVTKKITKTVPIKTILDGEVKTVGHQYTVEISSIVETDAEFKASGRDYRELSGTLQLKIAEDASKDTKGNTINPDTTTISDFVDFIKPEVRYKYSESDIDYAGKSFTMEFDIVDKYLSSITLNDVSQLKILIDGEEPNWDSTGVHGVTKNLTYTETKATINGQSKTVGRHYTLKLSHLEQLEKLAGKDTMDYSGIITVAIPGDVAKDTTNHKNAGTTITSGINILSGETTTDGKVVDVVDPIWERVSSTASAANQTATITVKGTDKYFKSSNLTANDIKVFVNGAEVTTNINKSITDAKQPVYASDGITKIGESYTVSLSGAALAKNADQIKIQIQPNTITDQSNHTNKATDLLVFNTLRKTDTETEATSGFLGSASSTNNKVKAIQRQNIDNITFMDNIPSSVYDKSAKKIVNESTTWDVSAMQDKSIFAWYTTNANGSLKVYIGSDNEIFGNYNSSYLFAYIGYSSKCTSTETITNIKLLNVNSVDNMSYMFRNTGYNSMAKLDLGDKFDTSNVTNMSYMFANTGNKKMTTLNFGNAFNTIKVTNMSHMFDSTGYTAMTTLNFGSTFNTSIVTNMSGMFQNTGYTAMTGLDLGGNFKTSKVTDMSYMFANTGHNAMTSLNLRSEFDTTLVTNMREMFNGCGKNALEALDLGTKFNTQKVTDMNAMFADCGAKITKLDLGDVFYTTNVKDMYHMFYNCGNSLMTELDLGPAFTRIPSERITETSTAHNGYDGMFDGTGKTKEIKIQASEQIYFDKNNFKLNTDATSSTINYTRGTINPKYRTEWLKEASTLTIDKANLKNSKITVTLRGRTNAEAGKDFTSNVTSSLTADKIHVYFDGVESTTVTKSIATTVVAKNAITGANDVTQVLTISGLDDTRKDGKTYTEWSGNISLKIDKKTLKDDTYNNQNLSAIDTSGTMTDIVIKEAENIEANKTGTMFIDSIRPEFTYIYSNTDIDKENKSVTVDFSVSDKYFDKSTLLDKVNDIVVKLTDTDPETTIPNNKIQKELTKIEDIEDTINGKTVTVGEKYRLVITGLQQQTADGKYRDYSGPISISIPSGVATDKSGNSNVAKVISIGVNEPGGSKSDEKIVDVVDPLWKAENINIDHTNKVVTVDLIGTDKYLDGTNSKLTTDNIKVYVDNEEVTTTNNVVKLLSPVEKLTETRDGKSVQYGVKYTLTLSNWEEATKQTTKNKEFFEWSGTTKITIAEGTLRDLPQEDLPDTVAKKYNTSKEQTFELGHVDFIKPKVEKVSSTKNASAKTETFEFNVIDKYLDTSDLVTTDEISVYVDGELVPTSQIKRTLTKESDISGTVNGTDKIIGHKYKLVLSDLEQVRKSINYDREYSDWNGNFSIKVAEGAVKDTNTPTPNKNDETTIDGDFVDFIKPNVTYKYSTSDIDYGNKTFTMVFDITDKHYASSSLTLDDLTIKVDGETPNWDNTGVHGVVKELTFTELKNNVNGASKVIGKRYTLKLSHLEQLEKLVGKETMDYSGVITVAIPADKVVDTSNNKNNAVTITSGIDIKGEEVTGDGTVVDVVDPIWEKVSSSVKIKDQTATIVAKGTDKFFASSNLTADKIKLVIDDKEITEGVDIQVGTSTPVYTEDGTTRIGDKYTITVSGSGLNFTTSQVKIRIGTNTITDNSGNTNKTTDLILFTTLKETNTETEATSAFLGNDTIERQNIENVTFVDNIPSSVYDVSAKEFKDATAWDVSAAQDKSIIAWYTKNANESIKVYIGSEDEIFGNTDSSYLFSYIGYSSKCTATETITNINLLNVGNVDNMSRMFRNTGYNAMTSLNLGDNFDTSNVTNMSYMFAGMGSKKMTTFNLGNAFNTSEVTDMSYMFNETGKTAMQALNLVNGFDTIKVTNMSHMFDSTGYTAMKTLNLGSAFNTSIVENMSGMFQNTGFTAMTSLDLGSKFKTPKVKDMSYMFANTGHNAMTSLKLGSEFDTTLVTNMREMFNGCGQAELTSLDLGTKFNTKNVTDMNAMFANCGTKITKLDLGDVFYTTKVKDMYHMFYNCGSSLMTELDLGPAFTRIPNDSITGTSKDVNGDNVPAHNGYDGMFDETGKPAEIKIQVSEQIYLNKNDFKLNTDATDSIINYTRGTINPKYRTEWIKEASALAIDKNNLENSKITVTLRGRTNAEAGKDFTSNVESSLKAENLHVYFDGEEATDITKDIATAATTKNATTGANDVLQVITLSNLEETLRQKGKNYKEWSGNISLKIDKKTLKDTTYNNQNLQAIDTSGTMEDIVIKEAENISANKTGTMFADYIRPEFTYEYSNTNIDYDKKNVTVVFDITDKYFKESAITLDNTTIQVDGVEPDWTKVTRTFGKKTLDADQTVGNITYKANGDIYTTINGKQQKIGERYELKLDGLETQNGEGYSGNVTLAFPAGALNANGTLKNGIVDNSGNLNSAKTITIGIDDPATHPEHKDPVVVDVVNPLWSYGTSAIKRVRNGAEADTVDVTIIGSDKYYSTNTLTTDKIKVYVDDQLESSITKNLEEITDKTILKQLATQQGLADVDNLKFVGYKLTLGNFGKINGVTKVVIDAGTIADESGNKNIETPIPVGNPEWVENGDDSENPNYPAFRNNIVDFIKPVIKYTYSAVEGATNPDIDYEAKTLTVKFTVTDKYIREDSIMNADGTLNADNIRIKVAGTDLTEQLHTTVTSQPLTDGTGTEYTFVVSNFELVYDEANKYQDYSGAVDFVFTAEKVDDTSGNKNSATTIT